MNFVINISKYTVLLLIAEDANDLLNEGVTKVPKSGYKLSRVSQGHMHVYQEFISLEIIMQPLF